MIQIYEITAGDELVGAVLLDDTLRAKSVLFDGTDAIVQVRNFGVMTEDELRRLLNVIEKEYPDLAADEPMEFNGNKSDAAWR